MEDTLRVQTKYNENLADGKVVVVTLLSNINRTWDFILDADAYLNININEDYYVTTQDNWVGTVVGIRIETVANAINLKATVLNPLPKSLDQVEVMEEELEEEDEESIQHAGVKRRSGRHPWGSEEEDKEEDKEESIQLQHAGVERRRGRYPWVSEKKNDQLDVEYKWLMEDKSYPLKAVHYLWEYKYSGRTPNVVSVRNSIYDLLLLKQFAEDKLSELSKLSNEEVDTYNKQIP